ncbi:MAG: tetratricopeptide repeat protein [Candidatus Eisenbacteria bacterium]
MTAPWRIIGLAAFAALIPGAAAAVDYDKIESRPPMGRIEAYEKLLGVEKDSVELLFKLGNAYYDAEMGEMAASFYRRSVVAGGDSKVVINLAFVLDELGKRDEAGEAYRDGLRRMPKDAALQSFYGDFLAADPDSAAGLPAAVEAYRRALDLDENCVEAHFGLGNLFAETGIYKEAIREWERVLAIDEKHRLATRARSNIEKARTERGR